MASIPWLGDVLRAAGVRVVEEGDWRNRGVSGSFNPIGVLWHHTAATSSPSRPAPALGVCINGRPDLQGPLCHALVDYNGVFHLISANRANHAGRSGGSGPIPAGDGNTMLIGWEIDYNGVSQHMTAAQYSASVTATAAVLRRLGRDASHARGHRETSVTGKIDPSFIDLNKMRADVAADAGAPASPAVAGSQAVAYLDSVQFFAPAAGTTEATAVYQKAYVAPDGWRRWAGIGGAAAGRPSVVEHNGSLQVFARNPAGEVMENVYIPGESWRGWVSRGGEIASDPVALSVGSDMHIFARVPDGRVYHRAYANGGWQAWEDLGGVVVGRPAIVKHGDSIQVYARTSNGNVQQKAYVPSEGGWRESWFNLGGTVESDPTVTSDGTNLHVYARVPDGRIYHRAHAPSGWQEWEDLAGAGDFVGNPSAVQHGVSQQIVARDSRGAVHQKAYAPGEGWHPWTFLDGEVAGDPVALSNGNALHVFARVEDGRLYHRAYTPSRWQEWEDLGGEIR